MNSQASINTIERKKKKLKIRFHLISGMSK